MPFETIESLKFSHVSNFLDSKEFEEVRSLLEPTPLCQLRFDRQNSKNHVTLGNYIKRVAGRAVPTGRFVVCSLAEIKKATGPFVLLSPPEASVGIPGLQIYDIYERRLSLEKFGENFTFFVNPTVFSLGKEVFYTKIKKLADKSMSQTMYLELPSDLAKWLGENKRDRHRIRNFRKEFGLSADEARTLVRDLIASGALLPDYYPTESDPDLYEDLADSDTNRIAFYVKEKTTATLEPSLARELGDFAERFGNFSQQYRVRSSDFETFLKVFRNRYGSQLVPLLEMTNPRNGLMVPDVSYWPDEYKYQKWEQEVLKTSKYFEEEIDISKMITGVDSDAETETPIQGVLGSASSDGKFYIKYFVGFNPTKITARFNRGWSELNTHLESIDANLRDDYPEVLWATVSHYQRGAFDDLSRQNMEDYLTLNCVSGSRSDLDLSNVLVTCDDSEFYLFDKVTGKRIMPMIPHMLNALATNLPSYKFLLGVSRRLFSFPGLIFWRGQEGRFYTPRITHGNVVLSLRTWKLPKEEFFASLEEGSLQDRYGMPDWIQVGYRDQVLPIHTADPSWSPCLKKNLKPTDILEIQEFYPHPKNLLEFNQKRYVTEQTVFFKPKEKKKIFIQSLPDISKVAPSLFWEIPCRPDTYQEFLWGHLLPWLKSKTDLMSFWIFYRDSDYHIRLRFLNLTAKEIQAEKESFEKLASKWQRKLWIGKPRLMDYNPEWITYGGKSGVKVFEKYSCLDTRILGTFTESISPQTEESLFQLAVFSVLYNCMFFPLKEAESFLHNLAKKGQVVMWSEGNHTSAFLKDFSGFLVRGTKLQDQLGLTEECLQHFKKRLMIFKELETASRKSPAVSCSVFFERLNHLTCNRLGAHRPGFESEVYRAASKALYKLDAFPEAREKIRKSLIN